MKKKLTLLFFLIGISLQAQKQEFEVNFATDSFTLSSGETNKLNTFIQSLSNPHERYTVAIAGHTDNVGEIAYNAVLSDKRANAIAEIFKGNGFLESKVLTSGRGEVHPIADNSNETGKAKNRRVRIIVNFEAEKGEKAENKTAEKNTVVEETTMSGGKVKSIGGISIAETVFEIDSQKKQTVTYKSGTQITIPENAFVDKNGKTVTGKVDLSYIEYRDPIDFMLSNIKMDHGGGHFNSGGMYKILAYQNNEPVFIGKDKSIDIDFMLTDNHQQLNLYQYDSLSGKWSEKEKLTRNPDVVQTTDNIQRDMTLSEAVSKTTYVYAGNPNAPMCTQDDCSSIFALKRFAGNLTLPEASAFSNWSDFSKMEEKRIIETRRLRDSAYLENSKLYSSEVRGIMKGWESKLAWRKTQLKNQLKKIERLTASYKVRKLKSTKASLFKVMLKATYNVQTLNFSQTSWQYVGNERLADEVYTTVWDDCEITKNGGSYSIMLKNKEKTKEIGPVYIVSEAKDKDALIKGMNGAVEVQEKKIAYFKEDIPKFEMRVCAAQQQIEHLKGYSQDLYTCNSVTLTDQNRNPMECFWERSKDFMTVAEQSMPKEKWLAYFDNNKELMKSRYEAISFEDECQRIAKAAVEKQQKIAFANRNAAAVTKSLKISSLGIYNCDQIERLFEPLIVDAIYETENGETIKPLFIYLVDSRINGIIRYDSYMNYTPRHFAFSPYSQNTLLAFDTEGGSYIAKSKDFKLATDNQSSLKTFVMKKIEGIQSRKELEGLF